MISCTGSGCRGRRLTVNCAFRFENQAPSYSAFPCTVIRISEVAVWFQADQASAAIAYRPTPSHFQSCAHTSVRGIKTQTHSSGENWHQEKVVNESQESNECSNGRRHDMQSLQPHISTHLGLERNGRLFGCCTSSGRSRGGNEGDCPFDLLIF